MNRERLLFASILGIVALYLVAIREKPSPKAKATPKRATATHVAVERSAASEWTLRYQPPGAFTLQTNVKPHPRALMPMPEARTVPNLWPPTSISVAPWRMGILRRAAAKPVAGEPNVTLPELDTTGSGAGGSRASGPRVDSFTTRNQAQRYDGQVKRIFKGRKAFNPAAALPAPPAIPNFEKYLCLLEIDFQRAQTDGVTRVEAALASGGTPKLPVPDGIQNFQIADKGAQQGWYIGAKDYLRMPAKGAAPRMTAGKRLMKEGIRRNNDTALLEWALVMFREAGEQAPGDSPQMRQQALLYMLEAANLLRKQELVLELAFQHLSSGVRGDEVWRVLGDLFSSRSYNLPELAAQCYAASRGTLAQRARVAVLIQLDRYDEAARIIAEGGAGQGEHVDLLNARISLAQGTPESLARARDLAAAHTGGDNAADAYQILGGVAYALGDGAQAETHFMAAVQADPTRSTAYSDLGLAYAVQGKAPDAVVCFDRAYRIDSVDNPVIPFLGKAYMKLNGGDADGAGTIIDKLREDNPKNLAVLFYQAYLHELRGNMAEAAQIYRKILDEDHRYRFVIQRLGLVQSQRVLAGDGDDNLAREAVAHLRKAAALNPKDPILRYILGRFLQRGDSREQDRLAGQLLADASRLPRPADDLDLLLWIEAAQARLAYRDRTQDASIADGKFDRVQDSVRRDQRYRGNSASAQKNIVHLYGQECRDLIEETKNKVIREWEFGLAPKEWKVNKRSPMSITFAKGRAKFQGRVNMKRDFKSVLDYCSLRLQSGLTSKGFFRVVVQGQNRLQADDLKNVEIGVGLVRDRRQGPSGVQIKTDLRERCASVRLDGGESTLFKQIRNREYHPVRDVRWPEDGKFTIEIEVVDRDNGKIMVWLNGVNVFKSANLVDQMGKAIDAERCSLFGRSGGRPITLAVWVEGTNGTEFTDVYLDKVTLTTAKN